MEPDVAQVAASNVGAKVGACVAGALVSPGFDGARVGASVGARVVGAIDDGLNDEGAAVVGLNVVDGATVALLVTQLATNPE